MRAPFLLLALLTCATLVRAAPEMLDGSDAMPAELRRFVEPGSRALFVGTADLNGDGRKDYVLVLEKQKKRDSDPDIEGQRPFLIVIRQADGSLKVQKRSDRLVFCSTCGGMMGDPLQSIEVLPGAFTVNHYGGSAWRWSNLYRFGYSRRDDSWQLIRVEETSFHAGDPDHTTKTKLLTPPRDYGKIDIAEFDPGKFLGQGRK